MMNFVISTVIVHLLAPVAGAIEGYIDFLIDRKYKKRNKTVSKKKKKKIEHKRSFAIRVVVGIIFVVGYHLYFSFLFDTVGLMILAMVCMFFNIGFYYGMSLNLVFGYLLVKDFAYWGQTATIDNYMTKDKRIMLICISFFLLLLYIYSVTNTSIGTLLIEYFS